MQIIHEEDILGDKSTFIELFKCLSVLENLTTWTWVTEVMFNHMICHCFNLFKKYILLLCVYIGVSFKCFDLEPVPRELPTSLVNLKYLCVEKMLFDDRGLPFLILLIKSSPNLVKLLLEVNSISLFI